MGEKIPDRRSICSAEAKMAGRQAFSLIELLVVIAVISILMTVLLPALKTGRDRALSTVCTSNLKQLGLAVISYANDERGYAPPTYRPNPSGDQVDDWYIILAWNDLVPMVDRIPTADSAKSGIQLCPSLGRYNNYLFKYGLRSHWQSALQWNILKPEVACPHYGGAGHGNHLYKPSACVLLGDTKYKPQQSQGHILNDNNTGNGQYVHLPHARHFGKANLWFVDGHADSLQGEELIFGSLAGQYGFSDYTDQNGLQHGPYSP